MNNPNESMLTGIYIKIVGREDADPDRNKLMLYAQDVEVVPGLFVPAHIKLQPGVNILPIDV